MASFDRWLVSGFVGLIGVAMVATSFGGGGVRWAGVAGGLCVAGSAVACWLALDRLPGVRRAAEPGRPWRGRIAPLALAVGLFALGALVTRLG